MVTGSASKLVFDYRDMGSYQIWISGGHVKLRVFLGTPWLEKKENLYIIIKFFYIWSILRTPSITKLGIPSKFKKKKKNYLFYFQEKKKFELKSKKIKIKIKICNRTKPMASPIDYRSTNPWILKKKKKKNKKQTNQTSIQSKSLNQKSLLN